MLPKVSLDRFFEYAWFPLRINATLPRHTVSACCKQRDICELLTIQLLNKTLNMVTNKSTTVHNGIRMQSAYAAPHAS